MRALCSTHLLPVGLHIMSGGQIPVGSSVLRQSAADDGDVDGKTIYVTGTVPMVFLPGEIVHVNVSICGGTLVGCFAR